MARDLVVRIVGDSKSLERALAKSSRSVGKFNKDTTGSMRATVRVGRSLTSALTGLGAGFVGLAGAGLLVREAFGEMAQAQKVTAQTEAVLKSTGGAAGVTAKEIELLSEQLMQLSGADDEAVQAGANMLLTFREVRNEAGRGNDVFTQATRAALDMSFALGKDMRTAALQLGKALNDPIRGITALRRSGVQFTKAQEKQIKTWVETGQIVRAQKAILAEVNAEFGNSARAAGDTLPGKLNILKESLRNLGGTLAEKLTPRLKEATDRLNEWLEKPENQEKVVKKVESGARTLGNAFGLVGDAIKTAQVIASDIQSIKEGMGPLDIRLADFLPYQSAKKAGKNAGNAYAEGFRAEIQDKIRMRGLQDVDRDILLGPRRARAAQTAARDATAARQSAITRGRTVFDARLTRQLDRLQDVSLKKQLAGLRQIAAAIRVRIAATKDLTRRLNLEDKLLAVLRQQKSVQQEIGDQIRAANEALKDRAEAIKSAVIDRLQRKQTDVLNKRALREAQEQLRIARYLGGRGAIRTAKERVADAAFDIKLARFERAPATLGRGGRFSYAGVVININGVTDPAAVANRVAAILKKRGRHTTTQTRPTAAASA